MTVVSKEFQAVAGFRGPRPIVAPDPAKQTLNNQKQKGRSKQDVLHTKSINNGWVMAKNCTIKFLNETNVI